MTVSQQLVAYAWEGMDLPDHVGVAVRRHILDGLGNAVASGRSGVVGHAVAVADALGGPREATVLEGGGRVSAPAAAMANGALVHGLDFDDTHADALVHATAVVLPASLAVAEQAGANGKELVEAAAAGYETVLRLGAASPHGFHAHGFHATSVVGVFGAALAASRLLGLEPQAAVYALGIAGSLAAGSLEFLVDGVETKQLHAGFAAMNGVLAARLAAAGATGPETIIEGDAGLYRLYTDQPTDLARVTAGLGERWELERITIKPYPVCQLSHAALDAAATVRDRIHGPAAIDAVHVTLPDDALPIVGAPLERKTRPTSTYDARFSLPFCLAVLFQHGHISIDDLGPAQLGNPALQALAAKVVIHPVATNEPAAAAGGHVRVVLADGQELEGRVPASRGSPDRPMTDDELVAKFRGNVGPAAADPEGLARSVLQMNADTDPVALAAALAGASRAATEASRPQGDRL